MPGANFKLRERAVRILMEASPAELLPRLRDSFAQQRRGFGMRGDEGCRQSGVEFPRLSFRALRPVHARETHQSLKRFAMSSRARASASVSKPTSGRRPGVTAARPRTVSTECFPAIKSVPASVESTEPGRARLLACAQHPDY
jgi:hypothetical protein